MGVKEEHLDDHREKSVIVNGYRGLLVTYSSCNTYPVRKPEAFTEGDR